MALHIYTAETPIYRIVNEALRNANTAALEQWKPFISAVTWALPQCPAYEGVAYRGIGAHIERRLYMPGYVVTWRAFSSATTSAKVARDFLGAADSSTGSRAGTLFIVEARAARQLRTVSTIPAEEEVLCFTPCPALPCLGLYL